MFEPNEQQQMIRDEVRHYARGVLVPRAARRDEEHIFPAEEYREMAGLGLLAMNVPEQYGGSEVGVVAYAMAVQEVAYADASVAVGLSVTNMVAEALVKFAQPEVVERYVPKIASGEFTAGSFALSEESAGSDPGGMKTRAVKKGDRWILNGTKLWITSATHSGVFIVWARTEPDIKGPGGLSAFAVPADAPGLSVGKAERKLGLLGSSTCELVFEDCEIPEDHLLYERGKGFRVAMMALDGGRIGIGSQAWGIGCAALDAAKEHVKQRRQFGRALADFQGTQFKISQLATERDAAWLLVMRAATLKEEGRPFTREASMGKLYASEWANRACAESIQMHGGIGYTKELPVERYFRDARVTTIYEGTSEIQRIVIAREELTD